VTTLLFAWRHGDQAAFDQLVSRLYQEFHRPAHCCVACQPPGGTLQSTALANEAFLRLVCGIRQPNARILVDYAGRGITKNAASAALGEDLDWSPERGATSWRSIIR
jgi:hypothetical protein